MFRVMDAHCALETRSVILGNHILHKTGFIGYHILHKTGFIGYHILHKTGFIGYHIRAYIA